VYLEVGEDDHKEFKDGLADVSLWPVWPKDERDSKQRD